MVVVMFEAMWVEVIVQDIPMTMYMLVDQVCRYQQFSVFHHL